MLNKRPVSEAIMGSLWNADFQGVFAFSVLLEYLKLFQVLEDVVLQP
jgi:hypothetical protein